MNKFIGMVLGGTAGYFLNLAGPLVGRYAVTGVIIGVALHLIASLVARVMVAASDSLGRGGGRSECRPIQLREGPVGRGLGRACQPISAEDS